jgi:glycosyltransferase involved in cell wall biosynthesis
MTVLILGSHGPALLNFRGPLIRDLIARGCRVLACAPDISPDIRAGLAALGAEARDVPLGRTGTNPLADLATYRALRRLFLETRPEVVLAYTAKPVIYGMMAARAAGVPRRVALITGLGYAFTDGGGIKRRGLRTLLSALYRRALARADVVVFQNPDDAAEFRAMGLVAPATEVITVAGSGVDLDHFPALPVPTGPPVFLMIARLIRDKGIGEYLEAAALVKARHPEAEFRLVGPLDPNPAGFSAADLKDWERAGTIRYLGEARDVRPHLAEATAYVLPSYREGTPRTVLEAMATGRAVITTDVPGCRETVAPGDNGLLVPARDPAALAEAMRRFIDQPDLAAEMGTRGRALAEARFDVRQVNAAMMRVMGVD